MHSDKPGIWGPGVIVFLVLVLLVVVGGASIALDQYVKDSSIHVTLVDRGYSVEVVTLPITVDALLDRYGIALGEGDEIEPNIETYLTKDTEVRITRAMMVRILADGSEKAVYLTKGTVQDCLKEAGVTVREMDLLSHPMDQKIYPGMAIQVTRMDQEMVVESEPIPYQVITRENNNLDEGVERVVQEGKQGELQRKILLTYRDGKEIDRTVVEEFVAVKPEDRIIERGTVKNFTTSRGEKVRYESVKTFRATAYTHTGNRTKTGVWPKVGMIAVDPKVIPLNTRVYVEFPKGYEKWNGFYKATDTGSAIKGNIIDVFMETEEECMRFGRRKVKVYFLKK